MSRARRRAAFADLLAGYCLEVAGRRSRCSCARPRWPRRCCSRSSARSSSATRGRCCASSCPAQTPAFYAHARDAPPRRLPRPSRSTEAKRIDALAGHPGARRRARARRRRPRRASRAPPARARADPRGDDEASAGARRCGRPPALRRSRPGMALERLRGLRARARCSSTAPTRSRAWGELRAFQARLIEPPARRARAAHRGRGHRPDAQRRRAARGSTPTASATCPPARSSPARTRTAPSGRDPLHDPARRRAASTSTASSSSSATARSSPPRAERGDDYLQRALATDDGARCLGEIGIGTNFGIDRPIGAILFDEKIGGTVHLALGRSYPETGGKNESALHWDLICDLRAGGRLSADGEVVQEDGRFASSRAEPSSAPFVVVARVRSTLSRRVRAGKPLDSLARRR